MPDDFKDADHHGPWSGVERRGFDERRGYEERQSQSWMEAIPPWARFITIVGIPGAIALFLVWMMAKDVPQATRQLEAIITEQKYTRDRDAERAVKQDQMFRLLQRICTNTAKSDTERQRCFDN